MDPQVFPLSKIVYPTSSDANKTGPTFTPRGAARWMLFDVTITGTANVTIQGRLRESQLAGDPLPFKNIVGAAPAETAVITTSRLISVLSAEEMRIVVDTNAAGTVTVLALDY